MYVIVKIRVSKGYGLSFYVEEKNLSFVQYKVYNLILAHYANKIDLIPGSDLFDSFGIMIVTNYTTSWYNFVLPNSQPSTCPQSEF